jgi:hypothetical protein
LPAIYHIKWSKESAAAETSRCMNKQERNLPNAGRFLFAHPLFKTYLKKIGSQIEKLFNDSMSKKFHNKRIETRGNVGE